MAGKKYKKTNNFNQFLRLIKKYKEIIIIVAALATILTLLIACFGSLISKGYNWLNYNFLTPNRIYLSLLSNQGKRIPLNGKHSIIYVGIKENIPIDMRFSLIQNNKDAPEISEIFINFPSDAEIKPILADGRIWTRTNSAKNQYFIDYSDLRFTKGTYWELPPLEVTFKKIGRIDFEYSIIGNRMKAIDERKVTINTVQDMVPYVTEVEVTDVRNTASGPVVEYKGK